MFFQYALVARGTTPLAEFSLIPGNHRNIALNILEKVDPKNPYYIQINGDNTFYTLTDPDHLTFLVMCSSKDKITSQTSFLQDLQEKWRRKYGNKARSFAPSSKNYEFGSTEINSLLKQYNTSSIEVCGYNEKYNISEKPNNQVNDENIVSPAITSNLDSNSILSYSVYDKTVAVTNEGIALGIGDNSQGQISGSLPKKILKQFTKIELRDGNNNPCSVISAVCGLEYTLFMISSDDKSSQKQLAYSHSNINSKYPVILNISQFNPISIFGGPYNCAAIDSEGSIIYIHSSFHFSPQNKIESFLLPSHEKAVNVACLSDFVIALDVNGKVFISKSEPTLSFKEISELNDKEIFYISGICCHCFAVSKDGKVFVYGKDYNNDGRLGLSKKRSSDKFNEIKSLRKYKICAAYAGVYHSLFQTQEGKLLACGNNEYGQLLLNSGLRKEKIYEPVETSSTNVSFCITGRHSTVIFKNREPPMSPNKQIDYTKLISIKLNSDSRNESDSKSEISSLKLKISELEKQLDEAKNRFNSQLSKKDEELKKQQEKYEHEIEKLKKEKSRSAKVEKTGKIDILDGDTIRSLEKLEKISSGSYGKVYKVAKRIIYALKVMKINITHEEFQKFLQEYELMHLLSHPNIVKTFGIFLSDETHPPSILLEFCPTNLDQKIKNEKLSKVDIVFIVYQIVEGMKYVHSQKVIHRDLKPTNILFGEDGFVKISDFGISKLMSAENQSMTGGVGTQRFMAPEILNEEAYNEKVDVYSFGVVLFFILSGGEMPKITVIQVGTGKKAPIPSSINSIAKELINKCWNFDFNDRPSFNDILIYLENNNFNLNELTEHEINEVKLKINEHKAKIPSY